MGKMAVRTEVTAAEFAQSYSAQARTSGVPRPSRASSPGRTPGTRRAYAEGARLATKEKPTGGMPRHPASPRPGPRVAISARDERRANPYVGRHEYLADRRVPASRARAHADQEAVPRPPLYE